MATPARAKSLEEGGRIHAYLARLLTRLPACLSTCPCPPLGGEGLVRPPSRGVLAPLSLLAAGAEGKRAQGGSQRAGEISRWRRHPGPPQGGLGLVEQVTGGVSYLMVVEWIARRWTVCVPCCSHISSSIIIIHQVSVYVGCRRVVIQTLPRQWRSGQDRCRYCQTAVCVCTI